MNTKRFLTPLLALLSLTSVVVLWKFNIVLLAVLILVSSFLLLSKKLVAEVKLFFLCGLLGAITEAVAIHYNVWWYANPNFMNIPVWLPVLWGIASVFIVRFFTYIKEN